MIYLLSTASGALLSISAPPSPLGPVVWVALVPLFIAIFHSRSYWQALSAGGLTGLVFHSFLFAGVANYSFWIYLLSLLLYAIPFFILSAFTFFAATTFKHRSLAALSIASLWFLVEKAMGILSLPYGVGLMLYDSPWAGAASAIGSSGLGALIICANVMMADAIATIMRRRISRPVLPILMAWLAILLAPFAYGRAYLNGANPAAEQISFSIAQPNWAPGDYLKKTQDQLWNIAEPYLREAAKDSPDAILFPENFGIYFDRRENLLSELKSLPEMNIVIGGIGFDPDHFQKYNSVFHITPQQGILSAYGKGALVPLIENAYAASPDDSPSFSIKGHKLLPLVCFESLIDGRLQARQKDSEGFLLLANETWFSTPTLPFVHIASLVMRSIEYGQPSAMAGNTISMVSDARGRFKTTDYRTNELIRLNFFPQRIETPYSRWNWISPYIAAIIAFGPLTFWRARK